MRPLSKEIKRLNTELFGNVLHEPPKKKPKLVHKNNQPEEDAPAWIDPEDTNIKINVQKNRKLRHLRKNFNENELVAKEYISRQRQHYQQSMDDDWTKDPKTDHSDNENENDSNNKNEIKIQQSLRITALETVCIPKHKLSFSDYGCVNSQMGHQSVITVIDFDKTGQLLMTCGLDKSLCLYSMAGRNNELLKKIFLNDMPIRCAKFTADGKEIIITGRRFFLYTFNLINFKISRINKLIGRDERSWEYFEVSPNNLHIIFIGIRGVIIIVSRKTKKPVKTLQISDQIAMIKFNNNGSKMYILTQNGIIYVFDMNKFRCIDKIIFDGIVKSTCFDIFETLNIIGIGCNSGVVTLYHYKFEKDNKLLIDRKEMVSSSDDSGDDSGVVKAIYSVNNLLTCINGVEFNHDGQLMCIWSKNKKQAIRLVHVESGKVYANWPKDKGLSYVYKARFSPKSGYLAVGNDHGYVKLIRLNFYGAM